MSEISKWRIGPEKLGPPTIKIRVADKKWVKARDLTEEQSAECVARLAPKHKSQRACMHSSLRFYCLSYGPHDKKDDAIISSLCSSEQCMQQPTYIQ